MRFRIQAPEASHGIRVIDEIPDLALCRVEGVNGVGKTLALHLLEICSGRQPYATRPHAWASLCRYLGPTEITVEGLRSAGEDAVHALRFVFDWRGREGDEMPREITTELFEEVSLDGSPVAQMGEVRELLNVVRIAGDQSLTDTIAGIVAYDVELLRSAAALAGGRGEVADRHAEELLGQFPKSPAVRAIEVVGARQVLETSSRDLEARRTESADRLRVLEAAEQAAVAAEEIDSNAGKLREEITELQEQAAAARERTEEAERALVEAREKERLSSAAEETLGQAESLVTRRLRDLEKLERKAESLAVDLDVFREEAAVALALEQLDRRREEVGRERSDANDAFALRDLLDGLVAALAPTVKTGLRSRVIARIAEEPITVGVLLDAVQERRARLAAEMPMIEELDRELAELGEAEKKLKQLRGVLEKSEQKRNSLSEAEAALEKLSGEAAEGGSTAERAAERAAAHRAEIEIGAALGSAQRQLAQLGGGASATDLQAELERHLREAGTTRVELAEAIGEARRDFAEARDLLEATGLEAEGLEAEAAMLGRELALQTSALLGEDAHGRLREILGQRAPRVGGELEEVAHAWLDAHAAADRAVVRVKSTRARLLGLQREIEALLEAIRHNSSPGAELDPVRKLYQERMLAQFDQTELRAALFDSGTLTRVDLDANEIVWTTAAGEPRVRPFEAFSSGERAFAYVQAQLGAVRENPATNKVVAIDEFGAFLSTDRLIRLQAAVRRQLDEGAVDQAIVALPLLGTGDTGRAGEKGYLAGNFEVVGAG
jgi:DNA repair exonuclease SbcCD ATPase subunit